MTLINEQAPGSPEDGLGDIRGHCFIWDVMAGKTRGCFIIDQIKEKRYFFTVYHFYAAPHKGLAHLSR